MKHGYKVSAGLISMCVFFFFLFSALYMNDVNISGEAESQAYGTAYVDGNRYHLQAADSRYGTGFEKDMLKAAKESGSEWQSQGRLARPFTIVFFLAVLLLGRGVFLLAEKGHFFACFQSSLFCLARFLCELLIREKKDGKKWASAF